MPNLKKQRRVLLLIIAVSIIAGIFSYQPLWQKISSFRPWSLGLDIAGGSYLIYDIDLSQIGSSDKPSVVNGLRDVIERRVNLFGVSEPKVYLISNENQNRLIIELAGIGDINLAIEEIGTTPFLDFREVIQLPEEGLPEEQGDSGLSIQAETTEGKNLILAPVKPTSTNADSSLLSNQELGYEFVPTDLTGRYVKGASLALDNITGQSVVNIEFNKEGAKIFEELTERNIGKPLAIFLDNQLIETPVVREKIIGGKAQISGNFSVQEARELVERFNAGALPAPITLINQNTISAELGQESLDYAVKAGVIGTLLIIIFMIAHYRRLGIFASFALIMYIALTLAVFKVIPVTMTLAGIAGIILSIGIAVDANILVFERTKEELKRGLSTETAIEEGFKRAWTSIRDSNISTIITSVVLYYFTSSFVRGFALALFIGVLVSMFSAITITRTMLRAYYKQEKKNPKILKN